MRPSYTEIEYYNFVIINRRHPELDKMAYIVYNSTRNTDFPTYLSETLKLLKGGDQHNSVWWDDVDSAKKGIDKFKKLHPEEFI